MKQAEIILDFCPSDECSQSMARNGAKRYAFTSQNIFGPANDTGRIPTFDPVIADVKRQLDADPTIDRAMLDFEGSFDSILSKGPTDSRYADTVNDMRGLLSALRGALPQCRFAYFGGPAVPYWSGTPSNASVLRPVADRRALVAQAVANYSPVLSQCDWTNPCIYLIYDLTTPAAALIALRYRRMRIAAAMTCAPGKPCIPAVRISEAPGGSPSFHDQIMLQPSAFLLSQVLPIIDSECDGIAIWSGYDWYSKVATNQPGVVMGATEKAALIAAFRTNWGASCTDSLEALRHRMGLAMAQMIDAARDVLEDRPARLAADVTGDGVVDGRDLATVLGGMTSQ